MAARQGEVQRLESSKRAEAVTPSPHSTPKYEGSTLDEILRLAKGDVEGGEQGTRGMYARALVDLEEQYEHLEQRRLADRDLVDALRVERNGLLEQLEAQHELIDEAHRFALVLAELKVATRPAAEAWLDKYRAAYPATKTHGRGCPCTPCQAEDWDAIDAGLRASSPASEPEAS